MSTQSLFKLLDKEDGSTETSLYNSRILIKRFGRPRHIKLLNKLGRSKASNSHFLFSGNGYMVITAWAQPSGKNFYWVFLGFAWGYNGEGPNGLADFLYSAGVPDYPMEVIGRMEKYVDKTIGCSDNKIDEIDEIGEIDGLKNLKNELPLRILHRHASPSDSTDEMPSECIELIQDVFGE